MVTLAIVGTPLALLTLAATCACLCGARAECPLLTREDHDEEYEAKVREELGAAA